MLQRTHPRARTERSEGIPVKTRLTEVKTKDLRRRLTSMAKRRDGSRAELQIAREDQLAHLGQRSELVPESVRQWPARPTLRPPPCLSVAGAALVAQGIAPEIPPRPQRSWG